MTKFSSESQFKGKQQDPASNNTGESTPLGCEPAAPGSLGAASPPAPSARTAAGRTGAGLVPRR